MYAFIELLTNSARISGVVAIIAIAAVVTHQLNPIAYSEGSTVNAGSIAGITTDTPVQAESDYIPTLEYRLLGANDVLTHSGDLTTIVKSYFDSSKPVQLVELYNPSTVEAQVALTAKVPENIEDYLVVDVKEAGGKFELLAMPDAASGFPIFGITLEPKSAKTILVKTTELEQINFAYNIGFEFKAYSSIFNAAK